MIHLHFIIITITLYRDSTEWEKWKFVFLLYRWNLTITIRSLDPWQNVKASEYGSREHRFECRVWQFFCLWLFNWNLLLGQKNYCMRSYSNPFESKIENINQELSWVSLSLKKLIVLKQKITVILFKKREIIFFFSLK